jgi:hypothetical protein
MGSGDCEYMRQRCAMTLAEGLAEYLARYPLLAVAREGGPAAREFFRCHDAVHVVFGCGISLPDEAVVKISSIFGTSAGFGVLRGYRLDESRDIYRRLDPREAFMTGLRSVVAVPRTIRRCRNMRKKWPWSDFDGYLDVPLGEIREEFGVIVAHPDAVPVEAHPGSGATS